MSYDILYTIQVIVSILTVLIGFLYSIYRILDMTGSSQKTLLGLLQALFPRSGDHMSPTGIGLSSR